MKQRLIQLQLSYLKYRHRLSPVLFLGSFFLDIKIVKRPDSIETIMFICVHLVLTTALTLAAASAAHFDMTQQDARRWSSSAKLLLDIALQFTFGALASALFVLYFKGADLYMSGVFVVMLALFLFGNEFAHKHVSRLVVRFLSTVFLGYAFLLYFVPFVRGKIGFSSVILATVFAVIFSAVFGILVKKFARALYLRSRYIVGVALLLMFIGFPLGIRSGVIPPLPLLLQEGSVVHVIEKGISQEYVISYEQKPFWQRLGLPFVAPTYTVPKNASLSFFTAVYAPGDMHANITHIWEYYHTQKRTFVLRANIPLFVFGGRALGYRTYSTISALDEGLWRVTAVLGTGQVLGHRTFRVVHGTPQTIIGFR
jgi:hypothetical protein